MRSSLPPIERAKPLLGTTVAIRVHGLAPARAHVAINAAFAGIAAVHSAMSFHEPDSEVSRLNREAHRAPIPVSNGTYLVIAHAMVLSVLSQGAFDITVAPHLVARGHLPRPSHAPQPDRDATWRDIQLLADNRIRFRRPLWIDLGGSAKGYAVDCAMAALSQFAPRQACINAGGDLCIAGAQAERVRLACDSASADTIPVVELANGSLASSASVRQGPHIDPHHRKLDAAQFVCVTARRCIDADALTKVVMLRGACSAKALAVFGANAIMHDAGFGWRQMTGRVQ